MSAWSHPRIPRKALARLGWAAVAGAGGGDAGGGDGKAGAAGRFRVTGRLGTRGAGGLGAAAVGVGRRVREGHGRVSSTSIAAEAGGRSGGRSSRTKTARRATWTAMEKTIARTRPRTSAVRRRAASLAMPDAPASSGPRVGKGEVSRGGLMAAAGGAPTDRR